MSLRAYFLSVCFSKHHKRVRKVFLAVDCVCVPVVGFISALALKKVRHVSVEMVPTEHLMDYLVE